MEEKEPEFAHLFRTTHFMSFGSSDPHVNHLLALLSTDRALGGEGGGGNTKGQRSIIIHKNVH